MKKIKSFEDACTALGLNPQALPDVSGLPEKHRKALIAHFKLIIIAQALNEGWEPNWNNTDEWKYFAWFGIDANEKQPSGFGFSDAYYDDSISLTGVGSRLCFKTSALALYAAEQFEELYKEYFLYI